jgi:hypothetical protein
MDLKVWTLIHCMERAIDDMMSSMCNHTLQMLGKMFVPTVHSCLPRQQTVALCHSIRDNRKEVAFVVQCLLDPKTYCLCLLMHIISSSLYCCSIIRHNNLPWGIRSSFTHESWTMITKQRVNILALGIVSSLFSQGTQKSTCSAFTRNCFKHSYSHMTSGIHSMG